METPSLSLKDIGRIYLDHNATTPPLKEVVESLPLWAQSWGNPSSIHMTGRGPKGLLREARQNIAQFIGSHPLELIFTSGGSESNNTIIKSVFLNLKKKSVVENAQVRNEYIRSSVEHPSVVSAFDWIQEQGGVVKVLPVGRDGSIDFELYKSMLSEKTALVSIMSVNNEIGTIFPIPKLCRHAHKVGAIFHTDAVQTLGKLQIHIRNWGVDFASFAGHKMYGLKGAGVIYSKKGQEILSLIGGGGQERGRRAGTENALAIAAFGHACKTIMNVEKTGGLEFRIEKMRKLRDFFEEKIQTEISGVRITGIGTDRLTNTSSLLISGIDGESLLMNLDLSGISVSTGAACSSGNPEPSPVLLAMGLTRAEAQSSLRVSLGWDTTEEEMAEFIVKLKEIVIRLRKFHAERFVNAN